MVQLETGVQFGGSRASIAAFDKLQALQLFYYIVILAHTLLIDINGFKPLLVDPIGETVVDGALD